MMPMTMILRIIHRFISPTRLGQHRSNRGYTIFGGLIALGTVDIGIGIGLLRGKQWAWKLAVILAFVSMTIDIISLVIQSHISNYGGSIIGMIIDPVILYYLYRPHVKTYFGKTISSGNAQPTM